MRITKSGVYVPAPFILGGRTPLKTGEHPHLAEVFPHAFIPRQFVIDQIKTSIRSGESIAVLGLPGIGKTTLLKQLMHEFSIPVSNHIEGGLRTEFRIRLAVLSGIVVLDDVRFYMPPEVDLCDEFGPPPNIIGPEIGKPAIQQALAQRKQLIIIEPPVEEPFLGQLSLKRFILPPLNLYEFNFTFADEKVNGRPLSFMSKKLIYDLSGGNYRIANTIFSLLKDKRIPIIDTILRGLELNPEEIKSLIKELERINAYFMRPIIKNFVDDLSVTGMLRFIFLPCNGRIKVDRFWTHFSRDQQAIIIRLIHYGILMVDKDDVCFRSPLVYQGFLDFFDPNKRQSQGLMIL